MQVIWNDELKDQFPIRRGIKWGRSLSPYIFLLCNERLDNFIEDSVEDISLEDNKNRIGRPLISHLIFADSLLLFLEGMV